MAGRFVLRGFTPAVAVLFVLVAASIASGQSRPPETPPDGAARDRSRVIVELTLPVRHVAEADLPDVAGVGLQRQAIALAADRAIAALPPSAHRVVRRYATVPYVAIELTPEARAVLDTHADVRRVLDDALLRAVVDTSVPLVEADQVWTAGYDGTGTVVAVLDSGVDGSHPMLEGKVVEEACFSTTQAGATETLCPNGQERQVGHGAAVPCAPADCLHGTHVAGIAAGRDAARTPQAHGAAPGADILAIQVFSRVVDPARCGGMPTCIGAFTSDVIAALEHVYTPALAGARPLAAANLSLGGGSFTGPCDAEPYKPVIDNLRAIGVATIVASGNSGTPFAISAPACVSSAISVGSTTRDDTVSWFSNAAPFLSLFAPGDSIVSSVPGGAYAAFSGTSMAAPHVAGAWSVLRQALPAAPVDAILAALRGTGVPVRDDRLFTTATVPRIRTYRALASLLPVSHPAPSISATDPTGTRAGSEGLLLAVHGGGFTSFSVARWNGVAVPTRVLSTTVLQAAIGAAHLSAAGTAWVSVHTPGPGGGTSGSLAFTILPPPLLTVSEPAVAPGSPVIVSLVRGFGGASDYLTLAATGSADGSYHQWTYVGAGIVDRTWTAVAPQIAGTYEFRLFVDGVRRATSAAFAVDPSSNPAPAIARLSPASTYAGAPSFTLTVTGSRFVPGSVVRWNGLDRPTTAIDSTALRASIGAAEVAAAGVAHVTVFTPAPGGGTSAPLPFIVNAPPTIAVSRTSAVGGSSVTATLANAPGAPRDWLALARAGSADTAYVSYVYVGEGVTQRTWTVAMPPFPGMYEFRLLNGDGVRAATSPVVTVEGPTLAIDSGTAAPLGTVTVTVTNGPGGSGDWLALAASGAADSSYLKYIYVGTGVTSRTWSVAMPSAPATYEFRMFADYGYRRIATSPPVVVQQSGVALTSLTPASAAAGGAAFTLTVQGSGFDAASIVRWNGSDRATTYVTASRLEAAIPASDIARAGTAQVTVFPSGAGAPALPFTIADAPSLAVGVTTVPAGGSVSVTLTGGSGSASDWLAIARTDAPDTSYLRYTYVGGGVTTRTWTVVVDVAGTYEFRLFKSGYTRVATSAPVTVADAAPAHLTVAATDVARGTPVTVTLIDGRGGASDWLAFAAAGSANTAYVQWVYVGAGVETRTWTVTAPGAVGTYEFRLFLNNGYTRVATSPPVTVR